MTHPCDVDCAEVATRWCYSCFRRLCEPHRGPGSACPQCVAGMERCGCDGGCLTCGLSLEAPSDQRAAS